jgi:hypothetical protein
LTEAAGLGDEQGRRDHTSAERGPPDELTPDELTPDELTPDERPHARGPAA